MGDKIIIRWLTNDKEKIRRIRERFGFPLYTTINGYTPATIRDEDVELLDETAKRGFLTYERKEWVKSGKGIRWER